MRKSLAALAVLLAAAAAVGGARAVVRPAAPSATAADLTLAVRSTKYGRILFDAKGRALYAFTRDPRRRSVCYGACAVAWPPAFVSGTLRAGKGVSASLLGTTKRTNGKRQATYQGRPLYYYVHDPRGVVLCQNVSEFGGLWLVVRPNGTLVR